MTNVAHILNWLDQRRVSNSFSVTEIPLHSLDQWTLNDGEYIHKSGKFFKVQGLEVETNYGNVYKWHQPIINQPEIGILGILYKDNKYLLQAKMEPGNVNILQLSPTVQATESNYKQVHKGEKTRYLEYFKGISQNLVIIDMLQTEQGGRFLEKINRNMIVDVSNEDFDIHEDYIWVTSEDLQELLKLNNIVNMDTRSILSCALQKNNKKFPNNSFLNWFSDLRKYYYLIARKIPISNLEGWRVSSSRICVEDDNHFSVIGVQVEAHNREVSSWSQPIFKETHYGMTGFLITNVNSVVYYLVQAVVEPGKKSISLTSTVQCSDYKNKIGKVDYLHHFLNGEGKIVHNSIQSEEGGRFFHFQIVNMILEVDKDDIFVQKNYFWITYDDAINLVKNGNFNIEARTLLACYNFKGLL